MLDKNNKCKCAQTWQLKELTNIILYVFILQRLILIISFILTFLVNDNLKMIVPKIIKFGMIFLLCMQLYYIYLMETYIKDLKTIKCSCVSETFTETLHYYGWLRIILTIISIITVLISFYE